MGSLRGHHSLRLSALACAFPFLDTNAMQPETGKTGKMNGDFST
jgi:hypothetical protein